MKSGLENPQQGLNVHAVPLTSIAPNLLCQVKYALADLLNMLVPENGHILASALPLRIPITRVWPPLGPLPVSDFTSKDDLVRCLVTGCYGGGGFTGNAPLIKVRGS
eukprot:2667384-Pyramimonas_sp.AAC.2